MKPRDSALVLASLALLLALVGVLAFGGDPAEAEEVAPIPEPPPAAAAPEPEAAAPAGPVRATRADPARPAPRAFRPRVQAPSRASSGIIAGDIALSPPVVRQVRSVLVRVREAINDLTALEGRMPYARNQRVEIDPAFGTPTFEIRGVPFSEYGYVVRVFADGFNGSSQVVQVTPEQPIANVVLSVTPAVPFTVLLRDQLHNPVRDLTVFMVPTGEPPGRPTLRGTSDNFGSVLFERVIAGDYKIVIGDRRQPRVPPPVVQVMALGGVQSKTVLVPKGHDLTVRVWGPAWGIQNAHVELIQIDTTLFKRYESQTDRTGKAVFEHLPPGRYQINVSAARFERWSRTVRVEEDRPPPAVDVRMVLR